MQQNFHPLQWHNTYQTVDEVLAEDGSWLAGPCNACLLQADWS